MSCSASSASRRRSTPSRSCANSRSQAEHSAICCWGVRPSTVNSGTPAAVCSFKPPMRFMKNSSRFEPTIARNLTRSRSGFRSSSASASTRRLNASQVSSRLRYSPGFRRSLSTSSPGIVVVDATTSGARPEPFLRVVGSVMPVSWRERSLLQEVYRLITRRLVASRVIRRFPRSRRRGWQPARRPRLRPNARRSRRSSRRSALRTRWAAHPGLAPGAGR